MDYKAKRKAKRIGKRFTFLAYAVMSVFAVAIIVGIVLLLTVEPQNSCNITGLHIILYFLLPIVTIFVLGFIGQKHINKRVAYKKYIDDYRQYNYFVRVLRIVLYTDKDRFKAANQYYKLVTEDALRRFIYSFMLTASYYSDDPKDVIKGKERLEEIISDFDPEKLEVQKISWF